MGNDNKGVRITEKGNKLVVEIDLPRDRVPELLTKAEVARKLCTDVKTVTRMITAGTLTRVQPGGEGRRVLIRASEVAALIEEGTERS